MKKATPFSYRNNALVDMVERESLDVSSIQGGVPHELQTRFHALCPVFRKNFWAVTVPFADAISKSVGSLIRDEVWNDLGKISGVLLDMWYCGTKLSIAFYINGRSSEMHNAEVFYYYKNTFIGHFLQIVESDTRVTSIRNTFRNFVRDFYQKANAVTSQDKQTKAAVLSMDDRQLMDEIGQQLYTTLVAHLNFIRYAQVETKELPAGQMTKFVDCKYRNDTKSNITILNSTWFTNLVKSDAFKVRGHFRLQPCGEGHKDRKLIWINDFQKEGYTAPARKLGATL